MTVGEARQAFCTGAGFENAGSAVLGFALDGETEPEDYTAALSGVVSFFFDFAQRTTVRKFVDGDRTVPLSDMRRFTLKICYIAGDPLHGFLAEAAENSLIVNYAFADSAFDGIRCGRGLVRLTEISQGENGRLVMTFVIENA